MADSTTNINWVDDENNYRQSYHTMNLPQAQTQQFPRAPLPRDCDWRWSGDARPVSTSTWSPVSPSQALPTVEGFDWKTLSPITPVRLAISTGVNRLTPNSSFTYCPETIRSTSFRQTDYTSPGGQSMSFSNQPNHEENTTYDKPGTAPQLNLCNANGMVVIILVHSNENPH
ncbi:hypothetical protein N7493_004280 [Penicillium malachiteum]|uniref:Uncharacterized protein n=1 Tax=Penicillium malachiteum TaxID=1324776 RepID=A0AAD6MYM0_9EURO|nr:hypothetical protein N7493_004280 [Penicillium malachiteum]